MKQLGKTTRYAMMLAIACAAGCVSIEQMAPPVDERISQIGAEHGYNAEALRRGRQIYLTDCARCHTVEPIDKYSVARWDKTLPEMAQESSLSEEKQADLRAYILTAHQAMESTPADARE